MNIAMDRVDTMEKSSLEVTNRTLSSFSMVKHGEGQALSSAAGPATAAGPAIRVPGLLASEFGTSRRGSRGLVEAAPSDASSDSLMESGSSFSASAFATIPEDTCGVDAAIPDRRSIPL